MSIWGCLFNLDILERQGNNGLTSNNTMDTIIIGRQGVLYSQLHQRHTALLNEHGLTTLTVKAPL